MAMKPHLERGGVALVLVPDRLLHRQWGEEIHDEFPDATILKAGDGHDRWRRDHRLYQFTQPGVELGPRVVLWLPCQLLAWKLFVMRFTKAPPDVDS